MTKLSTQPPLTANRLLAAVFIVATLSEITDITPLINACGGRLLMMKLEKLIFTQKG